MAVVATDNSTALSHSPHALLAFPKETMPTSAVTTNLLSGQPAPLSEHGFNTWYTLNGTLNERAVDVRASLRLPLLDRLYVTVTLGTGSFYDERRRVKGSSSSIFFKSIAAMMLGCSLFGLFCFLYLLKSFLKINVFSGESPLHPLYALFLG